MERKAPPTFDVLIEIQERDRLAVHHDVAEVVDGLLRGHGHGPELRVRKAEGGFEVVPPQVPVLQEPPYPEAPLPRRRQHHRIFPYAVNRGRLRRAIQNSRVAASVVDDLEQADVVLTLKSQEKRQPKRLQEARARGMPFLQYPPQHGHTDGVVPRRG